MKFVARTAILVAVGFASHAYAGAPGANVGMPAWETYEYGRSYLRIKPRSPSTAAKYFAQAAEMGDEWAAYELAELYRNGDGVRRDLKEAARLYESIADSNGWAQYQLGEMLRKGEGVDQDLERAKQLLESAVKQTGSQWPKFSLAQILETSSDGRELGRAIRLYREAMADGNSYASERYADLCGRVRCP